MATDRRDLQQPGLSAEELNAQQASELPDREATSLLDLDVNVDAALRAASPIDAPVANTKLSMSGP